MTSAATVQRQISPIPPGRYWVDLVGRPSIEDFQAWIRDMQGAAVLEVWQPEQAPAGIGLWAELAFAIFVVPPGRQPFFPPHLGYPSFAPAGVRRREDVIPPPTPEPLIPPWVNPLTAGASAGALLMLLVVLALKR